MVGNVEHGRLDDWVRFYSETMGFEPMQHFSGDQISTEYSALASTVVWDGKQIVMPINEPAIGRKKSQIQEYLDAYDGPGRPAHRAAHRRHRDDRRRAAGPGRPVHAGPRGLLRRGPPPAGRGDAPVGRPRAAARSLVDRDEGGHLLQIFTETLTDRPALFFEIIERRGATGFGEGNFKALFEAIERDQARRGNL